MGGRHLPLRQRFEAKIRVTPGCWLWTAYCKQKGYGTIRDGNKTLHAHRLAYEMYVGPVPDGLFVCHRCDNPSCVNPDHLWLGTQQENLDDMIGKRRDRHLAGEALPFTKLDETAVREVLCSAESHAALGRRFGVSPMAIKDARSGRTWKHISRIAA